VEGDTTWTSLDAPALATHVVDTHHRYLHEELPLVDALAAKVLSVHGDRHPELAEVRRLVAAIRADLEPHLMKEERVLFPAIAALASGEREFAFGSVANPIRMMGIEHDRAGELLAELRATTDGYAVPADGCASYRSLYERLEALELDTHLHIHKENHVLFPAALRIAER
jgi:regulator of cell morphogenesis and NO signaling